MILSRNNPVKERFKVLLVYANSPMDNLMKVSVSSLTGTLKHRGYSVRLLDTTFYVGTGYRADEVNRECSGSLQAAGFDYKEVGVESTESDVLKVFATLSCKRSPVRSYSLVLNYL